MAIAELKKGDVKDMGLADAGKRKIEWAAQQMPVLESIRKRFVKEQPLKGLRVSACLHVTSETANLMIALRDGGAETGSFAKRVGAVRALPGEAGTAAPEVTVGRSGFVNGAPEVQRLDDGFGR